MVPADWTLIPSGLDPGDSFRLIFISSTKRDANPTAIADYNSFVQNRAAAGHADIQDYSSDFRVVGSTSSVHARDNTSTTFTSSNKGVPIYWLNGNKVADEYEDFYDGSWSNEANPRNENGNAAGFNFSDSADRPFTGSTHAGTAEGSRPLGAAQPRVGRPNDSGTNQGPISSSTGNAKTDERRFYGLSPVFQVTTASTLISNWESAPGGNIGTGYSLGTSTRRVAQAFTTGDNSAGYEISEIHWRLQSVPAGFSTSHVGAAVYTSTMSNFPGDLVFSLATPSTMNNGRNSDNAFCCARWLGVERRDHVFRRVHI